MTDCVRLSTENPLTWGDTSGLWQLSHLYGRGLRNARNCIGSISRRREMLHNVPAAEATRLMNYAKASAIEPSTSSARPC